MATDRILTPICNFCWLAQPGSEEQVVLTSYNVFSRPRGRIKRLKPLARITRGNAEGELLMELTERELKAARELLARASVETSNYLNEDDAFALQVVPAPKFSPAILEFAKGALVVGVSFAESRDDIPGDARRRIRLCNGRASLDLPHFDCLG